MKLAIKLVIAGTALVGATANAGIVTNTGTTGPGDLVLFITDVSSAVPQFYAKDLNVSIDTLGVSKATAQGTGAIYNFDNGQIGSLTTPSSLGFTNDAGIQSFFAAHAGDQFQWSILAADGSGNGTEAPGQARIAGTFDVGNANSPYNIDDLSSSILGSAAYLTGFYSQLNLQNTAFPNTSDGWGGGSGAFATFFGTEYTNGGAVDSPLTFFLGATAGQNQLANWWQSLNTLTLTSDGSLLVDGGSGPSPVPLPAAVWLLGSGLLGLAGIGRRRNQQQAAA